MGHLLASLVRATARACGVDGTPAAWWDANDRGFRERLASAIETVSG